MPFKINTGHLLSTISGNHIHPGSHTAIPPEMKVWEKMRGFFSYTEQSEALECIRTIYNPSPGTPREDIFNRFEQLRRLVHPGYQENIQLGRYGNNHACILDASSHAILAVTFDNTGNYTLECEGIRNTHTFGATSPQTAAPAPQTAEDYDAIWSAWEIFAPFEEIRIRSVVADKMRRCLHDNRTRIELSLPRLTALPDYLPPNILELKIECRNLTSLPVLPPTLQTLVIIGVPLTSLPMLPAGLETLDISDIPLSSPPVLPSGLQNLSVSRIHPHSLPDLPSGLKCLDVSGIPLRSLPELPLRLKSLHVFRTPLSSLPALPSALRYLTLFHTKLSSLPELPPRLRKLNLSHTQLTSLPESIVRLSSRANVDLRNTHLTEHILQALRNMTMADDYSGPRILFDMSNPLSTANPATAFGGC